MNLGWFSHRRHGHDGIARKFSYESLQIATNNFSQDTLIGIGSIGKVYKGKLSNGTAVAVKVCPKNNGCWEEFLPMVEVMSHIRHRNIAQVLGFCVDEDSIVLVTEYAPNGSLFDLLNDPVKKKSSIFNWDSRAAICIGIAHGLSYLHTDATPRIIHMDIKTSNIVLNHNFSPQIIDFEGSKFIDELKESEIYAVRGTCGYIDPAFLRIGEYSPKSDVYSFGIVMLEIISGRNILDLTPGKGLMDILSKYQADGKDFEIIDSVLTDAATDEVRSFIDVGFLCIQDDPKQRPSMLEVWQMLYGVRNSSRPLITRPDRSMLTFCRGRQEKEDEEQEQSTGVKLPTLACNSNPEAEETRNEEEHSLGVNLLALTRTSNLVGGQSSNSLSSTAETSTTQERLHRTMVFKKHPAKYDFPEVVYPPFLTSVYRRRGSVGF